MAWVAVDENGSEIVFFNKPDREDNSWTYVGRLAMFVEIPKGSIYKLIGRPLTWSDEPVDLEEGISIVIPIKCDACGNTPNTIIQTQFGTYCHEHARYV